VDFIVTNYAFIEVTPDGLLLREAVPGVSAEEVQAMTAAPLRVAPGFHEMEL
jgi:3-oxoacid CoA-transferase subunit B